MANLGVVSPTISLAAPTVGSPVTNNTGANTSVTGQVSQPVNATVSDPGLTFNSVSNPYGVVSQTNNGNGNSLTLADTETPTASNTSETTTGIDSAGSGTGTSNNSSSGMTANQATSAASGNSSSSSSSLLSPNNIESTAQKLYKLIDGSGSSLAPLSSSAVSAAGMETANAATDTDGLLNLVDTSGLDGTINDAGSLGTGALTSGTATANSITDTGSLMSGVDTSGLDAVTSDGSGAVTSGLGDSLSSLGDGALTGVETGGVGIAGGLVGGEVGGLAGSPVGGGASGAASGAATGALIGSVVPGVGTAIGAVVGGLAGLFSGIMSGQHPTVGPDGNTSIQGWDSTTNAPKFVTGQDNGGSAAQSTQVANAGWDEVTSILKSMGGTATNAAGVNVGTFKGQFTVGNPGSGYVDKNNPTVSVGNNQTANSFSSGNNAAAEFIAQQLDYIGSSGSATGLTQDQLKQLSGITYQDVLNGNVPGMTSTTSPTTTAAPTSTTPSVPQPTDWGAVGAQDSVSKAPGFDKGGFVEGPGGPREDKVDAKLSNEEFVIPADVVDRLGGGDGTNRDKDAVSRGAKSLVQLIDHIRGPDASKFGRPKNVDDVPHPQFGLGGGMFTATEFSQGGSVGQIDRPTNISTPAAYDSKAMSFGFGGLIPRPGNNSNNFDQGGMIRRGMTSYADGGMTPWPNNLYQDGGLVHDNMENDTAQPKSSFKKRKSGFDAHGISQDLGMEGNYGHNYAKGGFVKTELSPSNRGLYARNDYNKGGLVKRPAPLTPPNATFQN